MSSFGTTSAQFAVRDPDVRLMLQVRSGEPGAFEQLVERYQNRLVGILASLTGRPDEAEDLAQEVFLRIYRARAEYHPQAKFSTWLFTIANNVALNALRRYRRKPTVQMPMTESGAQAQPEPNLLSPGFAAPELRLQQQELAKVIQQALEKLNERQRMAVVLNKFEDMSYEEIAAVMGITGKAVKSLLSRARGQLRELLLPYLSQDSAAFAVPTTTPVEDRP